MEKTMESMIAHLYQSKNFKLTALLAFMCFPAYGYDVNIVGLIGTETTAPIITTMIAATLQQATHVNIIASRGTRALVGKFISDLPLSVNSLSFDNYGSAPISILTDVLMYRNEFNFLNVPKGGIKIAYTMIESDRLPREWVSILNYRFDAAIVPDRALKDIYLKSGVKIPIFILPLPIDTQLLDYNYQKKRCRPFVFGISAGFVERKNYDVLLKAFAKAFAHNKNVFLKIHGSWGDPGPLRALITSLNLKNVVLFHNTFDRKEYINFLASCDCYVFPSKGEGYSLTPREAVALGIPCVVSNIPVHKELCQLKSVIGVKADIPKKAYFEQMGCYCGNYHECSVEDLALALKQMHDNHNHYQEAAQQIRSWTEQFTIEHLAPYYLTFVKPNNIILGIVDSIQPGTITTQSKKLFNLYQNLIN